MKKMIALLLVVLMACVGCMALAEENITVTGSLEEGTYTLQVSLLEGDPGFWTASSTDDSVLALASAVEENGVFTAVFEKNGEGETDLELRHIKGAAVDRMNTYSMKVTADGMEAVGGSVIQSAPENELDPVLSGVWTEKDTQFSTLEIAHNPEGGWNLRLSSPLTHEAIVMDAVMTQDCELEAFVFQNGRLYNLTAENTEELGEPAREDVYGRIVVGGTPEAFELNFFMGMGTEEGITRLVFDRQAEAQ